jgi:hypothetical protein
MAAGIRISGGSPAHFRTGRCITCDLSRVEAVTSHCRSSPRRHAASSGATQGSREARVQKALAGPQRQEGKRLRPRRPMQEFRPLDRTDRGVVRETAARANEPDASATGRTSGIVRYRSNGDHHQMATTYECRSRWLRAPDLNLLAAKCQGVDPVLSFDHSGTPKSAVAEAVRRYAGSLSPSGGAATSNAFTTPHSMA